MRVSNDVSVLPIAWLWCVDVEQPQCLMCGLIYGLTIEEEASRLHFRGEMSYLNGEDSDYSSGDESDDNFGATQDPWSSDDEM